MSDYCKRCNAPTKNSRNDYCSYQCSNIVKNEKRNANFKDLPTNIVWACGGGVQSTAIAALILIGKLPRPDYSVIVDTGYERSSTWEYVSNILIPKLTGIGIELKILKTTDYADNALFNNGCLLIPAYEKKPDGSRMRYSTMCSGVWKTKVIRRWLREQGVEKCITWLGISENEKHRRRKDEVRWNRNSYPLLDKRIDRDQCIYLIAQIGFPMPPHTSCFICPGMSNAEWREIKENYKADWERAIQIERQIQAVKPNTFLHYSLQSLEIAIEGGGY